MAAMAQTISRLGLLFTTCREAIVLVAYSDGKKKDGSPKYCLGIGHNSETIQPGDRITIPDAFRLLKEDMAVREKRMARELKVPVTQAQWDAMMDLCFNTGNRFVWDIVALVNAGKMGEAADFFLKCDHSEDGTKMPGLLKRRTLERNLFVSGDYGPLSPVKLFTDNPRASVPTFYEVQPGDL